MNRVWWKHLFDRNAKVTARGLRRPLFLEALEDRSLPSVTGFRPIDAVGNNVANPDWGAAPADQPGGAVIQLLRLSPAAYADGISTPSLPYLFGSASTPPEPSPRTISNDVFNQSPTLFGSPSTDINTVDGNGLSAFGYSFGQFIDHDLDFTPDQTGQPVPNPNPNQDGDNGFPIPADTSHPGDPIGSLAFSRSVYDPTTGTSVNNPRQQTNVITSYLDLSQVYGSSQQVADALRTFSGGQLKTSPGNMLPYNNLTYFTQDQLNALAMQNDGPLPDDQLYAAGDVRANENTELIALTTLFVRNHNLIAAQLQKENPTWTDEQLYQEARKINIAEYENIIYTQYLPALLGPSAPVYTSYNPSVNASIATEFSTVAFRFGHSMLNNNVARDANNGSSVGAVPLAVDFFDPNLVNPSAATDPLTGLAATDIGAYLKGDADSSSQAVDTMMVSSLRDELFGNGIPGGEDLASLDIWRARDDGIGTYNQVRVAFGLPAITNDASHGFDQITSNVQVQQELEQAYAMTIAAGGFAGDIDPYVGGLAEDHVPGSDMGPLFTAILANQFSRLENGDRYFYLNETWNPQELAILQQGSTLAQIITTNTGVTNLQPNVFYTQSVTTNITSTSVSVSSSTTTYGSPITVTASVQHAVGAGPVTGWVTFTQGNAVLAANVPLDATSHASFTTSSLSAGSDIITAYYTGAPGFFSSNGGATVQVQGHSTSTAVVRPASANPNPSTFGQPLTFTATVSNTSGTGATPTGLVTFDNGSTSIGSRSLIGGTATLTISALSVGTNAITATYVGEGPYLGSSSSSAFFQTVKQAGTSTSLVSASSSNPANPVFGQSLTFTATVSNISGGSPPTGMVAFYNGSTLVGDRSLISGTATLTLSNLAAGSDSITATYIGTLNLAGSSSQSALSQSIAQAGTSTLAVSAASGNANPSVCGQPLTFTATVSNTSGTSAVPSGLVTFYSGSTRLGSRSLIAGTATLNLSVLYAGSYSITATYNGTANFAGSSSASGSALAQSVTLAGTSTSVVMAASTNTNPSTFGKSLTFIATVANTSGYAAVPTGAVTFYNGSTALGTRSLVAGTATLTLTNLSAGTDSITATYRGSGGYSESSSPSALTQTVNAASTSTTVVASPSSATVGQSITFTATVTNTSTGVTPTGTVTFKDVLNGVTTNLGTRSLVEGVATFSTSSLGVGSDTMEAFYNVATDFLASFGNVLETVKPL